jgi:hypothetical protein
MSPGRHNPDWVSVVTTADVHTHENHVDGHGEHDEVFDAGVRGCCSVAWRSVRLCIPIIPAVGWHCPIPFAILKRGAMHDIVFGPVHPCLKAKANSWREQVESGRASITVGPLALPTDEGACIRCNLHIHMHPQNCVQNAKLAHKGNLRDRAYAFALNGSGRVADALLSGAQWRWKGGRRRLWGTGTWRRCPAGRTCMHRASTTAEAAAPARQRYQAQWR